MEQANEEHIMDKAWPRQAKPIFEIAFHLDQHFQFAEAEATYIFMYDQIAPYIPEKELSWIRRRINIMYELQVESEQYF